MPLSSSTLKTLGTLLPKKDTVIVGGVVRDRLLNRPLKDYDLCVPGHPSKWATKITTKLKALSFILDDENGVIRFLLKDGTVIDLAQQLGGSLEKDIDRRDYTINALSVKISDWRKPNWKSLILDRHNGLIDLKKKTLTALSAKNLSDDPLRLLRGFRIAAELGFKISPKTFQIIKKKKKTITKSAAERIREELLKIFSTRRAYETLLQLEKAGLLEVLLPEVKSLRKTAPRYYGKGGVLKHTLETVYHLENVIETLPSWFPKHHQKIRSYLDDMLSGYTREAHLKWAALLHDIGKPDTAKVIKGRLRFFEHEHVGAKMIPPLSERFRWSQEETTRYARLVRNHMRPGNLATHEEVSDKAMHRFFRDLSSDAVGMLLVSLGDHLTYLTPRQLKKRNSSHERLTIKMINRFYNTPDRVLPKKLIDGHDIMKTFKLKPSKLVGTLLTDLQEKQSEGRIKSKSDALAFVKKRLAALTA